MTETCRNLEFDRQQVKDFVRQVRNDVGKGWDLIGHDLRSALIDAKLVKVILSQGRSALVGVDLQTTISSTRDAMMIEAQLSDEEATRD